MRKFFIFVAFIICFIIAGYCKYDAVTFAIGESANPKYYFYVSLNSEIEDCHYTKNGNGGIICLNSSELKLLNNFDIDTLYGESVKFKCDDKTFADLIKKYKISVVNEEKFEDFISIYGYNSSFGKPVNIHDKNVNVQMVKRGDEIIVGFPIILGSY